jgi:Zn finger protein HypA/HybF involved in hydrogenase expression
MDHLSLFIYAVAGKILSQNSPEKKKEEIVETKKCRKCLRRVKTTRNECPDCSSKDFILNYGLTK